MSDLPIVILTPSQFFELLRVLYHLKHATHNEKNPKLFIWNKHKHFLLFLPVSLSCSASFLAKLLFLESICLSFFQKSVEHESSFGDGVSEENMETSNEEPVGFKMLGEGILNVQLWYSPRKN